MQGVLEIGLKSGLELGLDIGRLLFLAVLTYEAFEDYKKKSMRALDCILLLTYALGIKIGSCLYYKDFSLAELLLLSALLLSFFIGAFWKIYGMADAFVMSALALTYNEPIRSRILIYSLIITEAISIFLLLKKKLGKKYRIAFVPCLDVGTVLAYVFTILNFN